jgi:hypothetical protein
MTLDGRLLKRIVSLTLVAVLIASTGFRPTTSTQKVDTNAKIKAVFIYNFAKYIEWPSEYKSGEFTIGILGENAALYSELDKMSKAKKISNQSFSIRTFDSANTLDNPHILYIPESSTDKLAAVISKLSGKSTLIVTEQPGLAKKGAAINFVVVGSRQQFELNKANITSRNLKVASTLEQLGIAVN